MKPTSPPVRRAERATLQEVAHKVGVSASTVSLVLAGKADMRRISDETRDRVRQAAEELNYAPNLLTRSLRRGRTHVLSFFSSFRLRERDDQYMDKLSSAIETAGGTEGYDVLVHCNFNRSPREIYQFLNGGLSDGLILFAPMPDDPLLPLLYNSQLPVVILGRPDPAAKFPSVFDDVEAGMKMVVDEMLALGHRRIAAIRGGHADARDSDLRTRLLREHLAAAKIDLPTRWVSEAEESPADFMSRLWESDDRPTALFCWHDRLAYRTLEACTALGIRVPEELSILGYDGVHWPSETSHIATSVKVDLDNLALNAVRLLDHYIAGYTGPLREEVLPVRFLRGTTLAPPVSLQRSKK